MRNELILALLLLLGAPRFSLVRAPLNPSILTIRANDADSAIPSDRAFLQSVAKKDSAGVQPLLHADFSWIDSRGKLLTRAQFLDALPLAANSDVPAEQHLYGTSAVLRADRGKVHVLRVWTKASAGWQLLLYQEVTQVEKSEAAGGVPTTDCENPCKSIPFQPQTVSEKEAIASWQGVMKAMAENDAEAYSPLIADEFTATDTYHDRPYTKADRLAQIATQKNAGARNAPPALVSAQMFDLGETVLMLAREQRKEAKPYFNSRMWVKRDSRWQMLFSFNTRID